MSNAPDDGSLIGRRVELDDGDHGTIIDVDGDSTENGFFNILEIVTDGGEHRYERLTAVKLL